MKPTIPIYSREFVYTPSHNTDIRRRFQLEKNRIKVEQMRSKFAVVPKERAK